MKKIFVTIFCLPFLLQAQNQDSIFIKQISNEVLTNGKAYTWLKELTKNISNRLTASPAFYKAINWGKTTMQLAGANTVTLQQCTIPHWVRGKGDEVKITLINNKQQNIKLSALALGNSLAGKVNAPVIAINNFDELEQKKNDIKGKIVFYNYPFNATYIETLNAYAECGKYRFSGASRAAKYGAVGCIVRSLTGSEDNLAHTGVMDYNDSFPKIAAVAIGLKDADKLYNLCNTGKVNINILTHGKFLPDTIGYNVIGELKGTEEPNKIITIGGHIDSWDVGEGAHDDGAGCVHTMEVLRVLTALHYKPKHTIRFVLFANEENGTAGGNQYANTAVANNEKHIFALESDLGGFTPRAISFTINNQKFNQIQSWLPLFKPYGIYSFALGGGGTDIEPLNEKLQTPIADYIPDSQRYFDVHHTTNDVFETVNKRELLLGAINIAALIYLIDKYNME